MSGSYANLQKRGYLMYWGLDKSTEATKLFLGCSDDVQMKIMREFESEADYGSRRFTSDFIAYVEYVQKEVKSKKDAMRRSSIPVPMASSPI